MPIYEYRCRDCRRRVSVFQRSISSPVAARCDRCGGGNLERLLSRFSVVRGAGGIDSFDDADIDENDPRSMARWARRMAEESGEDMGPEFEEVVQQMEAGQMPDDLGDDGGSGPGDGGGFGGDEEDF